MFTKAVPLDPQDIQKLESALDPCWNVAPLTTDDDKPFISVTRVNGETPMALWKEIDGTFRLVNYERDKVPHQGALSEIIEYIF